MSSKEILTKVLDYLALTQKEFADKTGISKQAISHILGEQYELSRKNAERIKDAFPELNIDFLMTGKGFLTVTESQPANFAVTGIPDLDTVELPFVSMKVRAGYNYAMEGLNTSKINESFPIKIEYVKQYPNSVVIEIYGDSMEPRLKEGDRVLIQKVKPEAWQFQANDVFVVEYSGNVTIKRIKKNDISKGMLTLHPDNVEYAEPITIEADQIKSIWRVVKIVDSKRI